MKIDENEMFRLMTERHSVRNYTEEPIAAADLDALAQSIDSCNRESGLHIQLVQNEPKAFDSFLAHYGNFTGVENYIALVGKKSEKLEETCGFYGERLVLDAQYLGLNTCWVAMTYRRVPSAFRVEPGEKLVSLISFGHGVNNGCGHPVKTPQEISNATGQSPLWFRNGVTAALLAPSAMNQQKFFFTACGKTVTAATDNGPYTQLDLGIAKYHFEVIAGKEHFSWS